jgi:2-haloacid dehalogenase/putative hydrolase of the HAD superfamily
VTTPRPTGVLWDGGNVMVRWDPRTLYSKIFPDPAALRPAMRGFGLL